MSAEMAVSDNTTGDEAKVSNDEVTTPTVAEPEQVPLEVPSEPAATEVEDPSALTDDAPNPDPEPEPESDTLVDQRPEVKEEPESDYPDIPIENAGVDAHVKKEEEDEDEDFKDEIETFEHNIEDVLKKGIKRRASSAFSDAGNEEFKGFDEIKFELKTQEYSRILERLEAEVTAATKDLVPLRTVMATPPAPGRASKRPRKDTEGSRPSSALSSRSEGDGATDASATSSPAQRGGRRATTEISSPLLRVPLERGWKRELVYRAALDAHSRRNADIYYYTPQGKKLRSTREVAEHLSGTGLTVENFSFFKEPLGVDDPEKEIIRDAKLIRRVESPVAASVAPAPVEGKRTPKPKPPKGASPEPAAPAAAAAAKSPPAKLKVKSVGSRLSNNTAPAAATPPAATKQQKKPQQQQQQQQPPTTPSNADNNNSAAWKKPSVSECSALPARPPQPPPLQGRPQPPHRDNDNNCAGTARRQLVQPCSMSCGRGAVPSLACAACLCLYHPACAGYHHAAPPPPFLCQNCRKSPPVEPPPLTHKSGVTTTSIPVPVPVPVPIPVPAPVPRRVPVPVPVPVPAKVPRDKRVLLRMKVAGGTPDGERVWAVAGAGPPPQAAATPPPAPAPVPAAAASRPRPPGPPRPALPQGLAVLNGRRFVVVPRNMVHAAQHTTK